MAQSTTQNNNMGCKMPQHTFLHKMKNIKKIVFVLVFAALSLFNSNLANAQDCNVWGGVGNINKTIGISTPALQICADLPATLEITYEKVNDNGNPNAVEFVIDWDDGNVQTIPFGPGAEEVKLFNAATKKYRLDITHIYAKGLIESVQNGGCNYSIRTWLRVNGNTCFAEEQVIPNTVWDDLSNTNIGSQIIGPDPLVPYEICAGESDVVTFDDLSAFNCTPPIENNAGSQNTRTRWIQWVYDVPNPNPSITGVVTVGGVDVNTLPIDPHGSGGRVTPVESSAVAPPAVVLNAFSSTQAIGIPNTALAGEEFWVQINSWNFCNPYDTDGNPANDPESAPVNITEKIILIIPNAPKPTAADQDFCIDAIGSLTASSNNTTGLPGTLKWYSDAALTNQVGTGSPFAHGQTAAGSYSYWVSETLGNNCEGPAEPVTLFIRPLITSNTIAADQTICSGQSPVGLTGSAPPPLAGGDGSYSYVWQKSTTGGAPWVAAGGTAQDFAPGVLATTTWFRRVVNSGPCSDASNSVRITVRPPIANNTIAADQTICAGDTPAALAGSQPTGGQAGSYSYFWEQSTTGGAPWSVAVGTNNLKNYSPPAIAVDTWYRRRVESAECSGAQANYSALVKITIAAVPNPAAAGPDDTVCATTYVNLGGNAPGAGTGAWTTIAGTGIVTSPAVPTSGATNLSVGVNTFRWTITGGGGTCPSTVDDITITRDQDPVATTAGVDFNVCSPNANLNAAVPAIGTGTWTRVSSPGGVGNIVGGEENLATAGVENMSMDGAYVFRWTISNGTCTDIFDEITITKDPDLTPPVTGADQGLCGVLVSNPLLGNAVAVGETGTWSMISGPGVVTVWGGTGVNDPNATATVSLPGIYEFNWTISGGVCPPLSATIEVDYGAIPAPADAGLDNTVCGLTYTLQGNDPVTSLATPANGEWTMTGGPGVAVFTDDTAKNSDVTVDTYGTYTFQWRVYNSCPPDQTDPVDITFNESSTITPLVPYAECVDPTAFAAFTITGTINVPGAVNTGSWTINAGNGNAGNLVVTTPTEPNIIADYTPDAADITRGFVEFLLTADDPDGAGNCTAITEVLRVDINEAATVTVPANYAECVDPILLANFNVAGTIGGGAVNGVWEVVTGNGAMLNNIVAGANVTADYSPDASDLGTTITLRLRAFDPDGGGPCTDAVASVDIVISEGATADAGPVKINVCESDNTVTLTGIMGGGAVLGTWTLINNGTAVNLSATVANVATYTIVKPADVGQTLTFRFTAETADANCPDDFDDIDVEIFPEVFSNAGIDFETCVDPFTLAPIALNGNISGAVSTGSWSVVVGNVANVVTTVPGPGLVQGTYTPTAGDIAAGSITLRLTAHDPDGGLGPCSAVTDEVVITISEAAIADAGDPSTECITAATLAPFSITGLLKGAAITGSWTAHNGTGILNNTGGVFPNVTANYTPTLADIIAGSVEFTLTADDPDGAGTCGDHTDILKVFLGANNTVDAGLDFEVCEDPAGFAPFDLVGTLAGGATVGTWSISALEPGAGTLTVSTTIAGTVTATYTPTAFDFGKDLVFTLTSDDPAGCGAGSDDVIVEINRVPKATTTDYLISICDGDLTNIVLTSDVPGTTFDWVISSKGPNVAGDSPGSGALIAQTLTVANTVSEDITYTITPTITSPKGKVCVGLPIDVKVTIFPTPITTPINPLVVGPICSGGTVAYRVDGAAGNIGFTYHWSLTTTLGVAPLLTDFNNYAILDYDVIPWTGTLQVFATTASGCIGPVEILPLTSNGSPVADAGLDQNITCMGDGVIIGGAPSATGGSGGYSYSWFPTIGLDNPNIANPTATPTILGPTTYTLTVTDTGTMCISNQDEVVVTVDNPQPSIPIWNGPSFTCSNEPIQLSIIFTTGTGPYDITYQDDQGSPIQNLNGYTSGDLFWINPTPVNGGGAPIIIKYTILSVVDANACTPLGNGAPFFLQVKPLPIVNNIVGDTELCVGENLVRYEVLAHAGAKYNWDVVDIVTAGGVIVSGGGFNTPNSFVIVNFGLTPFVGQVSVAEVVSGCTGPTKSLNITAFDQVVADAGGDQTMCIGGSVFIGGAPTAANGSGDYSYMWTPNVGFVTAPTDTNPEVSPINTTTYTVTVTDNKSGCTIATDDVIVTVDPLPVLNFNIIPPICAVGGGKRLLDQATPVGGVYSGVGVGETFLGSGIYEFDSGAPGVIVGLNLITYNYTDPATTCSSFAVQTIDVYNNPTLTLDPFDNVCVDAAAFDLTTQYKGKANAVDITIIPGATFTYSGAGVTSLGANVFEFDPSVAGVGPHNITLSFIDVNMCAAVDIIGTITVDPLPVVSLVPLATMGVCEGPRVLIEGRVGGIAVAGGKYTDGGGGYIFEPSPGVFEFYPSLAALSGPGPLYDITYEYTDPVTSCTNTVTAQIEVRPLPVITLDPYADVKVCTPKFVLTGGLPDDMGGTVGNGVYSGTGVSETAPGSGIYEFDPSTVITGIYLIIYEYTDEFGCTNVPATQLIKVDPEPYAIFLPLDGICINDAPIVLTQGQPANGVYTGVGVTENPPASGIYEFDPAVAGVGIHTLDYTFTESLTCKTTVTRDIIVYDLPDGTVTALGALCNGGPLQFELTGLPPFNITYTVDDGINPITTVTENNVGNVFVVAADPPANTTYTLTEITDLNGCTNMVNASAIITITPTADFTVSPVSQTLPNRTVTITNLTNPGPAPNGWIYTWDFDDGNTITGLTGAINPDIVHADGSITRGTFENPIHEYATYGNYRIELAVSDGNCLSEKFQFAEILPNPPEVDFTFTPMEGCTPLVVEFTNLSKFADSYLWQFGEDEGFSYNEHPTYVYNQAGVYTVTLTGFNAAGIPVVEEKVDIITVYEQPVARFDIQPNTVYLPDEPAFFYNSSSGADSYLWDFGDGNTTDEESPRYIYETPGTYDVTLVAYNTLCTDTLTQKKAVVALGGGRVKVPNVFTPGKNGPTGGSVDQGYDGNNTFIPLINGAVSFRMEIYNRWGELLFSSSSQTIGWDGYYKDKLQPQGVYVYKVYATFRDGDKIEKIGDVTLIR